VISFFLEYNITDDFLSQLSPPASAETSGDELSPSGRIFRHCFAYFYLISTSAGSSSNILKQVLICRRVLLLPSSSTYSIAICVIRSLDEHTYISNVVVIARYSLTAPVHLRKMVNYRKKTGVINMVRSSERRGSLKVNTTA